MVRTWNRSVLIGAVVLVLLIPAAAIAAGGFDDVGEDNIFWRDNRWMRESGVTLGCDPPLNTNYCPDDYVTRAQMAAFMHRLAVNRVVDAATIEGLTAEDLVGRPGVPGPPGVPTEGPLNVHHSQFTPVGQPEFVRSAGSVALPNGGEMIAPVVLPQGVSITSIEVWVLADFDDQVLNVTLNRAGKTSGPYQLLASVAAIGPYEAGITKFEETTIANSVVDNDLYWYAVRANFAPDSYSEYDLNLYGVTIDYDVQ